MEREWTTDQLLTLSQLCFLNERTHHPNLERENENCSRKRRSKWWLWESQDLSQVKARERARKCRGGKNKAWSIWNLGLFLRNLRQEARKRGDQSPETIELLLRNQLWATVETNKAPWQRKVTGRAKNWVSSKTPESAKLLKTITHSKSGTGFATRETWRCQWPETLIIWLVRMAQLLTSTLSWKPFLSTLKWFQRRREIIRETRKAKESKLLKIWRRKVRWISRSQSLKRRRALERAREQSTNSPSRLRRTKTWCSLSSKDESQNRL